MAGALDEARREQLDHLAHEDLEALPLVQQHLSQQVWRDSQLRAAREYGYGGRIVRVLLGLSQPLFERQHRRAFPPAVWRAANRRGAG